MIDEEDRKKRRMKNEIHEDRYKDRKTMRYDELQKIVEGKILILT